MSVNSTTKGKQSAAPTNVIAAPYLPFSIDYCQEVLPAAGNRNGTTLNNAGSNGNYWSATRNSSNASNAYNLNFNSSNQNRNNNNRNNGFSVRPVSASITFAPSAVAPLGSSSYHISADQLLADLYRAYRDARRGKRQRPYQLCFESQLEHNLIALRNEIWERTYQPGLSTCFMITEPKQREIFAASFRDRIVHHLIFNYIYPLFLRTFIADSYSCITHRGTHYGVARLSHHIREVSRNYTQPCYVMKLDIRGYFMHINRPLLYAICLHTLEKKRVAPSDEPGKHWGDKLDYPLLSFLLQRTILYNPTDNCRIIGQRADWDGLPPDKSLFHSPTDCGLPIGNLTSQLFSNIYLNEFDQFMKRTLGCRHYGRYVDDSYVVSNSKSWLRGLLPAINGFLKDYLMLELHPNKVRIVDARHGVEFLGAYVKPYRTYLANKTFRRIKLRMDALEKSDCKPKELQPVVNSLLGVMSHYATYRLRTEMLCRHRQLFSKGCYDANALKFIPRAEPSALQTPLGAPLSSANSRCGGAARPRKATPGVIYSDIGGRPPRRKTAAKRCPNWTTLYGKPPNKPNHKP